jgi:hypothetical protein
MISKPFGDIANENFAAILRAPNDVIFAAVHDILVGLVSEHHSRMIHIRLSFVNRYR